MLYVFLTVHKHSCDVIYVLRWLMEILALKSLLCSPGEHTLNIPRNMRNVRIFKDPQELEEGS